MAGLQEATLLRAFPVNLARKPRPFARRTF
jgi:hypothetical protein